MAKYQTLPLLRGDDRGSIDPGVKSCAVALSGGLDERIRWVGAVAPLDGFSGELLKRCIVELPEANGRSTPPDDLIRATAAGFLLAGQITGGVVLAVTPRRWKGTVPKPAHHRRLWKALSCNERALLGGDATRKAIDAACLRGAKDAWSKDGKRYYRASELPTVRGIKITHDLLDAVALNLYDSGRLAGP